MSTVRHSQDDDGNTLAKVPFGPVEVFVRIDDDAGDRDAAAALEYTLEHIDEVPQ